MIESTLHGKSTKDLFDNEDILTSTFFGTLQFLQDTDFLNEILNNAISVDNITLNEKLDEMGLDIRNYNINLYFWEKFYSYGEPDLILKLSSDEEKINIILIIEVKLWSLKSESKNYNDQLLNYLDLLESDDFQNQFLSDDYKDYKIGLIYLTPRSRIYEINDSLNSIKNNKKLNNYKTKLFGLRWQDFYDVLMMNKFKEKNKIYDNLAKFIKRIGLTPFNGFKNISDFNEIQVDEYVLYKRTQNFNGFNQTDLKFFTNVKNTFYGGIESERK